MISNATAENRATEGLETSAPKSSAVESLLRLTYRTLCTVGRPIGGVRPRRIYQALARHAYTQPDFRWTRNRWGHELFLSPHYHLDFEIISFGTYDAVLHRFIERHVQPGMYCADVGADMGEVALHLAKRVGVDGRVYAFEPVPHVFRRLMDNIYRNHLQCTIDARQLAVLDKSKMVLIDCPAEEAVNQGLGSIMNSQRITASRQTAVAGHRWTNSSDWKARRKWTFSSWTSKAAEYLLLEGCA